MPIQFFTGINVAAGGASVSDGLNVLGGSAPTSVSASQVAIGGGVIMPGAKVLVNVSGNTSALSPTYAIKHSDDANASGLYMSSNSVLAISVNGSRCMSVHGGGAVGIGSSGISSSEWAVAAPALQLRGTLASAASFGVARFSNLSADAAATLVLARSRGSSVGSQVAVNAHDVIGRIMWQASVGASVFRPAGELAAVCAVAPSGQSDAGVATHIDLSVIDPGTANVLRVWRATSSQNFIIGNEFNATASRFVQILGSSAQPIRIDVMHGIVSSNETTWTTTGSIESTYISSTSAMLHVIGFSGESSEIRLSVGYGDGNPPSPAVRIARHWMRVPVMDTDPTSPSPVDGSLYYNSQTHLLRVRSNGAWQTLAFGSGVGSHTHSIADIQSGMTANRMLWAASPSSISSGADDLHYFNGNALVLGDTSLSSTNAALRVVSSSELATASATEVLVGNGSVHAGNSIRLDNSTHGQILLSPRTDTGSGGMAVSVIVPSGKFANLRFCVDSMSNQRGSFELDTSGTLAFIGGWNNADEYIRFRVGYISGQFLPEPLRLYGNRVVIGQDIDAALVLKPFSGDLPSNPENGMLVYHGGALKFRHNNTWYTVSMSS